MIERAVREQAVDWLADGRPAVVVAVTRARGSAPRGIGTRMLVDAGATVGTIGGGHLELTAIATARAALAKGVHGAITPSERHLALGPSLGQCCGGAVSLGFAPLDAAALAAWPAPEPLFWLQLHGAGHVGRAIATLLATLDVEVDWFDERDEEFPERTALGSPWPTRIRRRSADTIEAEVATAHSGDFFLVMTHEHALDLRIVEAVLKRGDAGFCGLIGSRTKRASFARRLEARGLSADAIAAMCCPIGIAGIAGKQPEVIAAAVVAELLQVQAAGPPTTRARGATEATRAVPTMRTMPADEDTAAARPLAPARGRGR